MFEKFTDRARVVVGLARREAERLNHDYLGTEHLLLGLVREEGMAARVLTELGLDYGKIKSRVDEHMGIGPQSDES